MPSELAAKNVESGHGGLRRQARDPSPSPKAECSLETLLSTQAAAARESARTIKPYDHTGDDFTLDEVERISGLQFDAGLSSPFTEQHRRRAIQLFKAIHAPAFYPLRKFVLHRDRTEFSTNQRRQCMINVHYNTFFCRRMPMIEVRHQEAVCSLKFCRGGQVAATRPPTRSRVVNRSARARGGHH